MKNVVELRKERDKFKFIYHILIVINIIMVVMSIYLFVINEYKLLFDKFFIFLFIANIITFFITYKIFDKYNFLKYQYNHFNNLKK